MAYRNVDREIYEKMVLAFREYGQNFSKVSRVVGVGKKTAKRGWEIGWPLKRFKAISECIADDQMAARAAIQDAENNMADDRRKMIEEAQQQAINARKQEGQIVKMARGGAINVLAQALKLLKASGPITRELEESIVRDLARDEEERILNIPGMISLLERIGRYTQQGAMLAEVSMRLERLYLGQPEQILGIQVDDMTPAQAMIELREAEAALQRFDGGDAVIDAELLTSD